MNDPRTLIDRYTTAATNLDADGLMSIYDENIRIFDLMMPWEQVGAADWRKGVDYWFSGVGKDPVVEASNVNVTQTDGMALLTMDMLYSHTNDEGNSEGMINRLTWVAVPDGDDWKVIHEHTSVPLEMPSMEPQIGTERPQ